VDFAAELRQRLGPTLDNKATAIRISRCGIPASPGWFKILYLPSKTDGAYRYQHSTNSLVEWFHHQWDLRRLVMQQ
jgi:hypothetical protein